MTALVAARVKDGVVHCGRETCSEVLGGVAGAFLVPTLGMVELTDAQGKPRTPPCYEFPHNVLWRAGVAAKTGKRMSTFRGRLMAKSLRGDTGKRFAVLSPEVWVKCPKCGDVTVVRSQPKQ